MYSSVSEKEYNPLLHSPQLINTVPSTEPSGMFARLQKSAGLRNPEEEKEEEQEEQEEGESSLGLPGGFSPVAVFSSNPTPAAETSIGSPPTRSPEVPALRGSRSSRASSVISTRTGVTIGTLQDDARSVRSVRSVDLSLGGRLFHINRDASRISVSEDERLPPYSPPAPTYSQQDETLHRTLPALTTSQQTNHSGPADGSVSTSRTAAIAGAGTAEPQLPDSRRSRPSFRSGPERISTARTRSAPEDHTADKQYRRDDAVVARTTRRLRRRKGVSLPRLSTTTRTDANLGGRRASLSLDTGSPDDMSVHSAGPSFGRPEPQGAVYSELHPPPPLAVPQSPAQIEEGDVRTEAPPAMDTENDISIHYSRLIRTIDHDHRHALHARDKELATARERLNEVDKVYRKELKSRDFTIDDLQKRLANLERQIERAQNRIEDEWEARWKHRDRHLMERMRRMELESQKQVERAVAQRDEEWVAQLQKQNSELFGKLGVGEVQPMQDGE